MMIIISHCCNNIISTLSTPTSYSKPHWMGASACRFIPKNLRRSCIDPGVCRLTTPVDLLRGTGDMEIEHCTGLRRNWGLGRCSVAQVMSMSIRQWNEKTAISPENTLPCHFILADTFHPFKKMTWLSWILGRPGLSSYSMLRSRNSAKQ